MWVDPITGSEQQLGGTHLGVDGVVVDHNVQPVSAYACMHLLDAAAVAHTRVTNNTTPNALRTVGRYYQSAIACEANNLVDNRSPPTRYRSHRPVPPNRPRDSRLDTARSAPRE